MLQTEKAIDNIKSASSIEEIESLHTFYLGKKGLVTQQFAQIKNCSNPVEKKELGRELNCARAVIVSALEQQKQYLSAKQNKIKLQQESIDITLPIRPITHGKKHVISQTIDDVVSIFSDLGFSSVSGSDIDDEFHIFDALNTPKQHPARHTQDSLYLLNGLMLRPHTSSVQIHTMENNDPPFKIIAPGRVYRHDWDTTHTPMFHQIEGLYVDKQINMSHLKFCIEYFIKEFFGEIESRFRPSFFPFTEPSAEVDIKRSNAEWLEILGCGMVHQNVLSSVNIDHTKYQGFAFGIGIERLSMLRYGITDLRVLFENYLPYFSTL